MDFLALVTVFLVIGGFMFVICLMDENIKELNKEKECLRNCGIECPWKCEYLDENEHCLHFDCHCQKLPEKKEVDD